VIKLVTDSNAQLPPELAERFDVDVVPLTVTVDGVPYLEGVELDADRFYERFASGSPAVTTSQPSPGRFGEVYRRAAEAGATEILSVHIGSSVSGTLNSARVAARTSPVPVRLVDTGTASFGVACCAWEAGEALAAGASVEEAASVAESLSARIGNVFVVGALDLLAAGGRLAAGVDSGTADDADERTPVPVLSLVEGEVQVVGQAAELDQAAEVMADIVLGVEAARVKVAIGIADAAAAPLWAALESRLTGADRINEIIRYRVGPSVGAHTGPGTAGAFFYAAS
jgi:DegV family protein with EDD domain